MFLQDLVATCYISSHLCEIASCTPSRVGISRVLMRHAISSVRFSTPPASPTLFGCLPVFRACAAIEQSLTPDPAHGLPVWEQDIRWSLLGFALERGGGTGNEETEGVRGMQPRSYLDWMEVELQVT